MICGLDFDHRPRQHARKGSGFAWSEIKGDGAKAAEIDIPLVGFEQDAGSFRIYACEVAGAPGFKRFDPRGPVHAAMMGEDCETRFPRRAKLLPPAAPTSDLWQNFAMETALSSTGHIIWCWLELHGIEPVPLFEKHGVTRAALMDPNERIPTAAWDAIRRDGMRLIGDPCACLKAARCWHPSNIGALGYAWLASATLRTALKRLERYSLLVAQSGAWSLQSTPTGLTAVLVQTREDPYDRALATDMAMALVIDMCRMNYGASLRTEEVTLRRTEPDCAESYRLFYGGEVRFSAPEDSFTLAVRDADRPLPSANRQIAGLHDRILAEQLATLEKENVVARCKAFILEQLTTGELSLEEAAQALHMSPRTLTRRLEAEQTTFSALLDETRQELARRYLADSRHSISEVAFLLGFQQQSSFTRAANRWFSMSPKEFRQSLS